MQSQRWRKHGGRSVNIEFIATENLTDGHKDGILTMDGLALPGFPENAAGPVIVYRYRQLAARLLYFLL